MKWDYRFMTLANHISLWSNDTSTKVGSIIVKDKTVLSMGYNGFPRGSNDEKQERYDRPLKYDWFLHAEENAIINAARNGVNIYDATMYVNWFPCSKCAGMIINAGIKRIVCSVKPDLNCSRFGKSFKIALEKLNECGVQINYIMKK